MLIYIPETTQRHLYVFTHIFEHYRVNFCITNSIKEFENFTGPKFTYGTILSDAYPGFFSSGLLEQSSIIPQEISTGNYCEIPVIFKHDKKESVLPYDVFSAVFFMLSRYEEYLPHSKDKHQRFLATESLAYKMNFLKIPVVDYWLQHLADKLHKLFPELVFNSNSYSFIPTYDIDIAWAYLHKGIFRNAGGLIRDFLKLNLSAVFTRISTIFGLKADPYDSYQLQFNLQEKYQLNPIYFIHPGTYGKYDKNVSLLNKHFIKLLGLIDAKAKIALHPSYLSTENSELLKQELKMLGNVFGRKILHARQHFIKICFPDTYRAYVSSGITDDYSMGYATHSGFRAGTSKPFKWYDLLAENPTTLTIHPFALMEGIYKYENSGGLENMLAETEFLIKHIRKTEGTFICIWHNESLGNNAKWRGWSNLYEQMIKLAHSS